MNDVISRQEEIDLLKKWSDGYSYIEVETNSAIKAFEEMPSAQPETREKRTETHACDLISREAVLDRIENALAEECRGWMIKELKTLRMSVAAIPSAQPERKKGKWVWNQYDKPHIGNYHCSVCRNIAIEKYTYCPNCGADMRGESDEML